MLVALSSTVAAGPYDDCILANMKGIQSNAAAGAIMRACEEKTTPTRCRPAEIERRWAAGRERQKQSSTEIAAVIADHHAQLLRAESEECKAKCAASGWWNRTFGDCAAD